MNDPHNFPCGFTTDTDAESILESLENASSIDFLDSFLVNEMKDGSYSDSGNVQSGAPGGCTTLSPFSVPTPQQQQQQQQHPQPVSPIPYSMMLSSELYQNDQPQPRSHPPKEIQTVSGQASPSVHLSPEPRLPVNTNLGKGLVNDCMNKPPTPLLQNPTTKEAEKYSSSATALTGNSPPIGSVSTEGSEIVNPVLGQEDSGSKAFSYIDEQAENLVNLNLDELYNFAEAYISNLRKSGSRYTNFVDDHTVEGVDKIYHDGNIPKTTGDQGQPEGPVITQGKALLLLESGSEDSDTPNSEKTVASSEPHPQPVPPPGAQSVSCIPVIVGTKEVFGLDPKQSVVYVKLPSTGNCTSLQDVNSPTGNVSVDTASVNDTTGAPSRRAKKRDTSVRKRMYELGPCEDPTLQKKCKDAIRAKKCRENHKKKMEEIVRERDILAQEVKSRRLHEKAVLDYLRLTHGINIAPYQPPTAGLQ